MSPEELRHFKSRVAVDENGCWRWTGAKFASGYAESHPRIAGRRLVHRNSYEHFVGPIQVGLTIDHLCRVKDCVNPEHLEAVTSGENTLRGNTLSAANKRKRRCVHGHSLADAYVYPRAGRAYRRCRKCQSVWNARRCR